MKNPTGLFAYKQGKNVFHFRQQFSNSSCGKSRCFQDIIRALFVQMHEIKKHMEHNLMNV